VGFRKIALSADFAGDQSTIFEYSNANAVYNAAYAGAFIASLIAESIGLFAGSFRTRINSGSLVLGWFVCNTSAAMLAVSACTRSSARRLAATLHPISSNYQSASKRSTSGARVIAQASKALHLSRQAKTHHDTL
jgi:hypothetical protein